MCRDCYEKWLAGSEEDFCDEGRSVETGDYYWRMEEYWQMQEKRAACILTGYFGDKYGGGEGWCDVKGRPAVVDYDRCGRIRFIGHYDRGVISYEHGPAIILYDKKLKVKHVEYWLNGKLHNPYGPANKGEYWLNGRLAPFLGKVISKYLSALEPLPQPIREEIFLDFAEILGIDMPEHPEDLKWGGWY